MVIAPRSSRVGEISVDVKIEKYSVKFLSTYHEKIDTSINIKETTNLFNFSEKELESK